MKFNRPGPARKASGYALAITLCFILVIVIVFASMLSWSSSNSLLTDRNILYNQTEMAAEAATENAMASIIHDFDSSGIVGNPTKYISLIPSTNGWPVLFKFSDTNGVDNQISVSSSAAPWGVIPSQFSGLKGVGNNYYVSAQASPVGQRYDMTAKVSQSLWAGEIPLFQFAIFYNMDLEINPGNNMFINGRVHANGNIYASGPGGDKYLTFADSVDASQMVYTNAGPWHWANSGNVNYANSADNPVHDAGTIYLPVGTMTNNDPTNVLSVLGIPPSNFAPPNYSAAYSTNGTVYFENEVDLIISNAPNGIAGTRGTNLVVYYQNPNDYSPITPVPPDVTNVVAGVTNYSYSFVTNGSFYDYREGATVQSVDVNVGKLNTWMTTGAGVTYNNQNKTGSSAKANNPNINSIYVISSVPQSISQLPAVRMLNGEQLPASGLTVATPLPVYVQGNYNVTTDGISYSTTLGDTTHTEPAAIMADALTLLSAKWSDTYNSSTSLDDRKPENTTLNAATMEGIVPSTASSSGVDYYSGGAENFLRLLEDWAQGHKTVTYNGSIVVMFPSQYATNAWGTNYYSVPRRQWGFDTGFTNQNHLPPLTPEAKRLYRATWSPN